MKYLDLLNTDPLAQAALVGLVSVLVVTAILFGFIMTRRGGSNRKG
ncbi:MAG: hypothetical protein R3D27_14580 [Hyphomicrobiaceae bacterium]